MSPQPLIIDSNGWGIGIAHAPSPNFNTGLSAPMNGHCMHTMVGDNAWAYFQQRSAGVSAHFCVEQDGEIHQCVSVLDEAWHICSGNNMYFGTEHADHGNPKNPLTQAQMEGSARCLEATSFGHNALGGYALRAGNFAGDKGYVCHGMGGAAWGGHSCPDYPTYGIGPRSKQRLEVVKIALGIRAIRDGSAPKPPPPIDPGEWVRKGYYRHEANGAVSLQAYAHGRKMAPDAIYDHSMASGSPLSKAHRTALETYKNGGYDKTMHIGLIFYTSKA